MARSTPAISSGVIPHVIIATLPIPCCRFDSACCLSVCMHVPCCPCTLGNTPGRFVAAHKPAAPYRVLFQTVQHPMLKQSTGVVHTYPTPCACWVRHASALLLSCRSLQPLDLQQLLFAKGDLYFVLVNPKFEAPTAEMRAVLPKMVPMTSAIHNSSMGASLVSSFTAEAAAETHVGTASIHGE